MSFEKGLYRSVPTAASMSNQDDQSETLLLNDTHHSRTRGILWYIAQAALVMIIVVQSVVIVVLSRTVDSSCRSVRKFSTTLCSKHCLNP
jgi:hypothetical protein